MTTKILETPSDSQDLLSLSRAHLMLPREFRSADDKHNHTRSVAFVPREIVTRR